MFVWIVIAACWVGLLLLILHDVTKDDDDGSAVSIASRNATVATARGLRRLRRLRRRAAAARKARTAEAFAQAELATVAAATAPKREASPQTVPEETGEQAVTEQTVPGQTASAQAAEPPKKTWWRRDQRAPITPAELEHTITEAIRKTAPECNSFVGVIVHHKKPKQSRDPNWGVRGVKYGKADRRVVEETLARTVKQLQKEFRLADPQLRN